MEDCLLHILMKFDHLHERNHVDGKNEMFDFHLRKNQLKHQATRNQLSLIYTIMHNVNDMSFCFTFCCVHSCLILPIKIFIFSSNN